jgi:hypothetical protein
MNNRILVKLASNKVFVFIVIAVAISFADSLSTVSVKKLPRTVDEAANIVKIEWLSEADRAYLLKLPFYQVSAQLHHGLGTKIRNEFGLWHGNILLKVSCFRFHPDNCSDVIIHRVWELIRSDADKVFVRKLDCMFNASDKIQIMYRGFYKMNTGQLVDSLQKQINRNFENKGTFRNRCSIDSLKLKIIGEPDLNCWVRAEFSESKDSTVSLKRLLGWICWRNGISYQYNPPYLEFIFNKKCTWPEPPGMFGRQ